MNLEPITKSFALACSSQVQSNATFSNYVILEYGAPGDHMLIKKSTAIKENLIGRFFTTVTDDCLKSCCVAKQLAHT